MAITTSMHLQNFIDAVTKGNFKLANEIYNTHLSLLHGGIGDAEILAIYNFFLPYQEAYYNAYGNWQGLQGQGQSGTQGLMDLLADLSSTKIRLWDITIQGVYDLKSTEYKALLPNRRTPFQSGSIELRIAAVNALLLAIGSNAALQTLKTQIQTFYNLLLSARDSQVGGHGAINAAIQALDAARLAAAQAMYKNYGSLIVKFYMTPEAVGTYMPMNLIQTRPQTEFTGTTNPGQAHKVLKRKLDILEDHLELLNDSDSILEFYFNDGLTELPAPGEPAYIVPPHTEATLLPPDAGYTDLRRHLWVRNTGVAPAMWSVGVE